LGYASIENLYRSQQVLNFPETYCLEKINGCSAWLVFTREVSDYTDNHGVKTTGNFHYHGGNLKGPQLKATMPADVEARLAEVPGQNITIYGEAYGGNIQKCADRYGPTVKFCCFDVFVDGKWLTVPEAEKVALSLGLEFVHYVRIPTKLSEIDFWRDATSEQAIRNGITTRDGAWVRREGVVLRTINEELDHRGNRIIAKHKRAEERETKTERKVDTAKLEMLKEARAIAEEWVTSTRLVGHILPKIPGEPIVDMTRTKEVISAMLKDIEKESVGEIEWSLAVNAEIGKRTAQLLKQHFEEKLRGKD
jgi:hypothetical protein